MKHICSTYSDDPRPDECGACRKRQRAYCYEHGERHSGENFHDECEACEIERNMGKSIPEDELIADFTGMTGSLCDEHLREEMYEEL